MPLPMFPSSSMYNTTTPMYPQNQQYQYPAPNQQYVQAAPFQPYGQPAPFQQFASSGTPVGITQYTTYVPQQQGYATQYAGYPSSNPMPRPGQPQVVYAQSQPQRGGRDYSNLQNMGIGAAIAATICCCLNSGGSDRSCSDHNMNPFDMGGMSHSDCSMDYL